MRCDQALSLLNALADGELNVIQARPLRKHLRRCAACTEEMARIQRIGELARQWRAVSAPPDLLSRIVRAQAPSSDRGAELPFSTKEQTIMESLNTPALPLQGEASSRTKSKQEFAHSRSRFGRAWRPALALSGFGLAAGIFALSLMPTHKTVAWAAVRKAMQQVRTIHWNQQANSFTLPEFGIDGSKMTKMETWARLDQPAYVILGTPDGAVRSLITPGKMTTVMNGQTLMEMPMPALGGEGEQGMRDFILAQIISPGKDASASAPGGVAADQLPNKNDSGMKSEETVLNGRPAVRFYEDTKSGTWHFAMSLWVDPETQLVERTETVMSNPTPGQPELHTVADQFRYNEQPPAGIFDLPQKK